MNNRKINFKLLVPHLIAIVIFYIVTILYFSPLFLDNKDLPQGDVVSYIGWGDDVRQHYEKTGERAFWSNAMFGGMPSNYAYPQKTNNIFAYLTDIVKGFLPSNTAGPFFIYLLGFYIFMLALGCNSWLSVIGAIAYAFASYNLIIIEAGHVSKVNVMATMAPIIGGVIMTYRGKVIIGSLITLIFTGLNILFNHQQISYYLIIMLIVIAIVYLIYAIKEKTITQYLKHSAILIVVALLAVAPAVDKLLPTLEFSKETMRGGAVLKANTDETEQKKSTGLNIDYAYQWSYGKMESFTLLIPDLYGGSSHYNIGADSHSFKALKPTGQQKQFCRYAPMYWGDQPFTSGPVYVGAIICLLFIFGLITYKGPEKWWVLAVTIISLILSWGKNFMWLNEMLFNYLPLYNKFRTPSMALVIAEVSMVTLAILSIKQIIETDNKKQYITPLIISGSIVGGLCLIFAFIAPSLFSFSSLGDANYPEWLVDALHNDRKDMLLADSLRSFMFIGLAFVVIYIYLADNLKSTIAMLSIVGFLIFIDLWMVDKRFLNDDSYISSKKAKTIEATDIDKYIMQDNKNGSRVLNLTTSTFNESKTSYYHKSIGGYSPAKLRRYQDIIDHHISKGITPSVLNMLNTGYIIFNTQQGPRVQQNPDAMGHAWFVNNINWMETPDEEIVALSDVDIKTTALMDKMWKNEYKDGCLQYDSTAFISSPSYEGPGKMTYQYTAQKSQTIVFSEIFYKTWKAYVDGEEVPILRANYILRALQVPAGNHEITFECTDDVYLKWHSWSLIFSMIVGCVILGLLTFLFYIKFIKFHTHIN